MYIYIYIDYLRAPQSGSDFGVPSRIPCWSEGARGLPVGSKDYLDARGTPGSPRFPLKGSFKGDIGIDIDVDMDIDLDARGDLVSRLSNGPYRASHDSYGLVWGLLGDTNQTY